MGGWGSEEKIRRRRQEDRQADQAAGTNDRTVHELNKKFRIEFGKLFLVARRISTAATATEAASPRRRRRRRSRNSMI